MPISAYSGASVAPPSFACGAGRETRTPTPKRWYLKPMRLPIPPYPHVGRRYVTMFRKGQARLSSHIRFRLTFRHLTKEISTWSPAIAGNRGKKHRTAGVSLTLYIWLRTRNTHGQTSICRPCVKDRTGIIFRPRSHARPTRRLLTVLDSDAATNAAPDMANGLATAPNRQHGHKLGTETQNATRHDPCLATRA